MKARALVTILALIAAAALSGCTFATNGKMKYVNLLNRKSMTSLEVGADGSVKVKGYTSDASEAIKAAAEGATKGALEAAAK